MSDEVVKLLGAAEPRVIRWRTAADARDGRLPVPRCPHPVSAIQWLNDDATDGHDNLFVCMSCTQLLRLVDFHGREAADG